jgi:hypothetical protein
MGFKDEYLSFKNEKYLSDEEIRNEMELTQHELYKMKLLHGIVNTVKRPRKNYLGFTEEMLQKGEKIGLTRRLMYKRVNELHWSYERAVREPNNRKRDK